MMKEKKTSLTNNENEFDITVFPSIVEKSKYQDSLLASSTDASKALEALTKNSGVDALLKNQLHCRQQGIRGNDAELWCGHSFRKAKRIIYPGLFYYEYYSTLR